MPVKVESIVAQALCEWLRMKLPAKCTELNLTRAAVVKAALAGPYTIPASGAMPTITLSKTSLESGSNISLTSGSRTAAQIAAEINATIPGMASADSDGRLVLTGDAPTTSTVSVVSVQSNPNNVAFGWESGGVDDVRVALVAPTHRAVMDGFPQLFNSDSDFNVIVGDRSSRPILPSVRRDEHAVLIEVVIAHPAKQGEVHISREHIQACLQAVRECVLTTEGRQLGRAGLGDIVLLEEAGSRVSGSPLKQLVDGAPLGLFDFASLNLAVRVYERPPSS